MPVNVRQCQREGTERLRQIGLESAALDNSLLLAYALGQERSWLYAHPEYGLTDPEKALWLSCLAQRLARRPLPYIVGYREFMGMDLLVDERVLIPRPETEQLVELAQAWLDVRPAIAVADVGTGSGCIALAIAHIFPDLQVFALDISAGALEVAKRNADRHKLLKQISFIQGDLLSSLPMQVNLILANLPYVSTAEHAQLEPEIRNYEPDVALVSGQDGLQHFQKLISQLEGSLAPEGSAILECGSTQADALQEMLSLADLFAEVQVHTDLAGLDRCVTGWGHRPK